jgi:hypothetical protein
MMQMNLIGIYSFYGWRSRRIMFYVFIFAGACFLVSRTPDAIPGVRTAVS